MSGLFVSFEGGEASGKSTQIRAVAAFLAQAGYAAMTTREPGGSDAAETLRSALLAHPDLDALSTGLLIAAGRRHHVHTLVRPALQRGAIVLCDRYIDSTWAYQHGAEGLTEEIVHSLVNLATDGLEADITFILDIPVAAARARWQQRQEGHDRYEGYDDAYHERVRRTFLARAAAEPQRCHVLDAAQPAAALTAQIASIIMARVS